MSEPRKKLEATSKRLETCLGSAFKGYQECLRKYFAYQLSKVELDAFVRTVLGKEHSTLWV